MKTPKEADKNTISVWKNDTQHQCNVCNHPAKAHRSANVKGSIGKDVNWCSVSYCRCKGYSD